MRIDESVNEIMSSRSVAPKVGNTDKLSIIQRGNDFFVEGTEAGDGHGAYLKSLGAMWERSKRWLFKGSSQLATVTKYIADNKSTAQSQRAASPQRAPLLRAASPTKSKAPDASKLSIEEKDGKFAVRGTEKGDGHGEYLKSLGATWQARSGAWWFDSKAQLATVRKYIADGKVPLSPKKTAAPSPPKKPMLSVREAQPPSANTGNLKIIDGGKEGFAVVGAEPGDVFDPYFRSLGGAWRPSSLSWWFSSPTTDTATEIKAFINDNKKSVNKPYIEDTRLGFLVKGTTANDEHGPHLKALGGMWQYNLEGWFFNESQRQAVEDYLSDEKPKKVGKSLKDDVIEKWNVPNTLQVIEALSALKIIDYLEGIPSIGQVNISFKTKPGIIREQVLKVLRENNADYSARFLESQAEYENPIKTYKFRADSDATGNTMALYRMIENMYISTSILSSAGSNVIEIVSSEIPIGVLMEKITNAGFGSMAVDTLAYVSNYNGIVREMSKPTPISIPDKIASPTKSVVKIHDHHIQHAKLFELTNWNGNFVVPDEENKAATYLAHWRVIALEQPDTIDERLVNAIKLKSFTVFALASHSELVADLRDLNIPYIRGMTRFAAIVTAVILRSPSLSTRAEYKALISELTPGL